MIMGGDPFPTISGVVILGLKSSSAPHAGTYVPGPLELDWFGYPTNANLRATYLETRASEILYGKASLSGRWHRLFDAPIAISTDTQAAILTVAAVEIFTFQPNAGTAMSLGLAHFKCSGPDAVTALHTWLAVRPGDNGHSEAALSIGRIFGDSYSAVRGGRRICSIALLIPASPPSSAISHDPHADPWSELDNFLWSCASLTPSERLPPDKDDPSLLRGRIYLSETWRALALRDGVGFVARLSDDPFLVLAEILVRTVYTDVALLAHLQDLELNAVANELSDIYDRRHEADSLKALVQRATVLRNQLWWDDVTTHGQGNAILRAIQDQLGTNRLFVRVMEDLAAFRAEVDSEELEATRISQERFESTIKRAGSALALATLVLGVFQINITGLTTGVGAKWWLVIGSAATAGILGWLIAGKVINHQERSRDTTPATSSTVDS
jgi:hypothetical protein